MADVRIVLKQAGVRELLNAPGVQADLAARARRIAAAAGRGHQVFGETGARRARAAVLTASWGARWGETRNRTLTRAIDAGRG